MQSPAPSNLFWQTTAVDKAMRSQHWKQKPLVLWLTGLSGSGKSTIAVALEAYLHQCGYATYLLDGDNIRQGLNCDLGFSEADRAENVRRIGEVAKLMLDAGLIVVVCAISPYRAQREAVRTRFESHEFHEVFISTPLQECERRDPKGLYRRARQGQLLEFTGISAPYEAPNQAEIILDTSNRYVADCVEQVASYILALQGTMR